MGTIFSEYDIRGRFDDNLTVEYAWTVGKAFSEWLSDEGDVVVFKSSNANAELVHGFVEGLLLQGRSVVDGGEGDGQAVIAAIHDLHATAGAVITHDDVQNAEIITLFDAQGVLIDQAKGLADIQQLADSGNFLPAPEKGHIKSLNA